MTCREAVDKLYEYLDNELDSVTTAQIKKHLDLCRLCCDNFEFEKTMKDLVHKCCRDARAPAPLKSKIIEGLEI